MPPRVSKVRRKVLKLTRLIRPCQLTAKHGCHHYCTQYDGKGLMGKIAHAEAELTHSCQRQTGNGCCLLTKSLTKSSIAQYAVLASMHMYGSAYELG